MSRLRRVSNCLIVAASAWMQGRAKHWIAARAWRKSRTWRQMRRTSLTSGSATAIATMVDFIPRRRKVSHRFLDEGQSFVIRLQRFRLEGLSLWHPVTVQRPLEEVRHWRHAGPRSARGSRV